MPVVWPAPRALSRRTTHRQPQRGEQRVTDNDFSREPIDGITRRQVLRGALAGGAMLSAGGLLAACGGSSGGSSSAASSAGSSPANTGAIKAGGFQGAAAT